MRVMRFILIFTITMCFMNISPAFPQTGGELISKLNEGYENSNKVLIKESTEKLILMGEDAVPLLENNFGHRDIAIEHKMIRILGEINKPQSIKFLLVVVSDQNQGWDLKDSAMEELQKHLLTFKDVSIEPEILSRLTNMLQDEKWDVRWKTARILGNIDRVEPEIRASAISEELKKR